MPRSFAAAALVATLSAVYMVVQVGYVRPHLWPAGHGARVAGDARFTGGSAAQPLLLGRPPDTSSADATLVRQVRAASPAARAGIRAGDVILEEHHLRTGERLNLRGFEAADGAARLRAWRAAYRMGVRDPLQLRVRRGAGELELTVRRPAAWQIDGSTTAAWLRTHTSGLLQIVVFVTVSVVLLALRATDPTAVLAVLALTFCAVAGGGPTLGGERVLPSPLSELVTILAWLATPLGFIAVSFAIAYFPRKADLLVRRPVLVAVPFAVCAPMVALSACSAAFLVGLDAALPIVAWDAANPWAYFASFAAAVAMNVAIVGDGLQRFRATVDPNERRRIQIAVLTVVPGVLAYALKDGVPAVGLTIGRDWTLPWWLTLALQLIVLLPAFGLTYVVAVHRVFAPATVLRRSLQYALARQTLAATAMVPAGALVVSLVRDREMSINAVVSGAPLFYLATTAALVGALAGRDRARLWLDRRFFREAYDAREILLSLASRITYETDPNDLTAMVVDRIDTALHPELVAVLVAGVDPARLTPITVLHGRAAPLPADGGLAAMLKWSSEPLELYVTDARSPAARLPGADQEWLKETGAVLLVPVVSRGSTASSAQPELIAVIALGARRSEEPYTAEDRQLLAGLAAQMALALDVARLRQRGSDAAAGGVANAAAGSDAPPVRSAPARLSALAECPQCGRCASPEVATCPDDRTAMRVVAGVPHVVEQKYRVDRVIGRGGMGAVYRARDVRLDRDVAIKVVRADLLSDPEARTRFRREAQIVARLQHPGIVSVFDYGTFPDGAAYLVLELVRGEDLRRVLRRDGALPPARALPLVAAICGAVHAAHRAGVLHRDLKPENVLLIEGEPPVKVLDFGVAKVVSEGAPGETALATLTGTGVIVGTPAYMAPEQLRSEPVDARTDVFSLGVMAYEMLTGELPFGRASLWEIGVQQAEGVRPMRSPHGPVPPHVERAVARALSVDPVLRPATAADFARALTDG